MNDDSPGGGVGGEVLPQDLQTSDDEPNELLRVLNNAYVTLEDRSDIVDAVANCVLNQILAARAALKQSTALPPEPSDRPSVHPNTLASGPSSTGGTSNTAPAGASKGEQQP